MVSTSYKIIVSRRILAILAVLTIIASLAFVLPNFVSDGTEKFSGKELEIELAKETLAGGYVDPSNDPLPEFPALKMRIADVYKLEPEKQCSIPGKSGVVYWVNVSKVTFFGIEYGGYVRSVCVYN